MAKYGSFEDVPLLNNGDIEAQNQLPINATAENQPESSQSNLDESTETCPICFDDLKDKKIEKLPNCGHRFCMPCIGKLVDVTLQEEQLILKCPLCRSESNFAKSKIQSILLPLFVRGRFWYFVVVIMLLIGGAVILWSSGKAWALVISILLFTSYMVSIYA